MNLMSWLEEPPANPIPSRDYGLELLTRVEASCSPILPSLLDIGPDGWYGRTSPASCLPTTAGHLAPLSKAWKNSGIMRPGECLTLNTSEWTALDGLFLNDEGVSSLSDILETGDVPQQYFLTPKACAGILRRAAKRGKELPEHLRRTLEAVAIQTEAMDGTTS